MTTSTVTGYPKNMFPFYFTSIRTSFKIFSHRKCSILNSDALCSVNNNEGIFSYFAFVPIQYIIPFSSKSYWCLKVILVFGSFNFVTNANVDLSLSYHCLATIFRRYRSSWATVLRGSIFKLRPVRSTSDVSQAAFCRRKRSLLVKVYK